MAARLSRRKYAVATKALNQLIANEAIGVPRRLRAIELLLNLHERHDRMIERVERAKARGEAGLPPEPVEQPVEQTDAVGTTEQTETVEGDPRLRSVYDKLLDKLLPGKAGSVAELADTD